MSTPSDRYDPAAIRARRPLAAALERDGHRLERVGARTWRLLCPFHAERTPSCIVYEADEHFHCFGCGAHGDVIRYVMLRDGVSFVAACRSLEGSAPPAAPAPDGGRPRLPKPPAGAPAPPRAWDRLLLAEQAVMNAALELYHERLLRAPGALEYLRRRGVPLSVVRACRVGYADGRSLARALGPEERDLAEALTLLRPDPDRPDRYRERMAGRIVVPELRGGDCIWMIGRRPDDRSRAKYLALEGEKPVLGQERVRGCAEVGLCEGVFDYLWAIGGIELPVCSPCGTHFPAERLGFLARARVVYGFLDGDHAGRSAAAAFGEKLGERWRPVRLPEGQDLNDLGRAEGGGHAVRRLLLAASGETGEAEVGAGTAGPGDGASARRGANEGRYAAWG